MSLLYCIGPAFRTAFRPALINIGLQWVSNKVEVAKK